MKLFNGKGCLTDEGLQALISGNLDELGRLEAAEHLSYCNHCLDRYTALLVPDVLEQPKHSISGPVLRSVWASLMETTLGRSTVAAVAALLTLTFCATGAFQTPQAIKEYQQTAAQKPTTLVQREMENPFDAAWKTISEKITFAPFHK